MSDENQNTRNLDLNLGPGDISNDDGGPELGSSPIVSMNFEYWLDGSVHRVREVPRVRHRTHRRRSSRRPIPVPLETGNLALELTGSSEQQTGEGNFAAEESPNEVLKECEKTNGDLADDVLGTKESSGLKNGNDGSYFDCNICLDVAKDPVVTCCGHLFCWPCLYQWLQLHSNARECPVCKGEVSVKNVTPIYGRGNNTVEANADFSLKIPLRPRARRVESWRQTIQRTAFTIPMEEMIRRLGSAFDLNRELSLFNQYRNSDGTNERDVALLNRIMTSSGLRRERPAIPSLYSDDVIDPTENIPVEFESRSNPPPSSPLLQPANSAERLAAESLVGSYFRGNPSDRNLGFAVDDRNSASSIAAVIHSESQTVDTTVEIDSTLSLSTSSSRRTNNARALDRDNGDSRPPWRRRLN